ncbi:hypothetical protein AVEN_268376-1 [Araneus ventricosus]|uniref:Uncharacterized protein n=1 Tax=Araneus ventricosus TaxID=182803 RepID=A0A4Y2LMU4_ARAVE|nr:hypothetical protein AVEN_268376-1 [Araneus ventricosus]
MHTNGVVEVHAIPFFILIHFGTIHDHSLHSNPSTTATRFLLPAFSDFLCEVPHPKSPPAVYARHIKCSDGYSRGWIKPSTPLFACQLGFNFAVTIAWEWSHLEYRP